LKIDKGFDALRFCFQINVSLATENGLNCVFNVSKKQFVAFGKPRKKALIWRINRDKGRLLLDSQRNSFASMDALRCPIRNTG